MTDLQKEMAAFENRTGILTLQHRQNKGVITLKVPVKITKARKAWGRIDLLVSPLGGSGEVWAGRDNVKMDHKNKVCVLIS